MSATSKVFPYLRSCKQESSEDIDGEITGVIPPWLTGCLVRNGPGLLEVGPDRYSHLFDGLALLHRFRFTEGKVSYRSRFLRSDAYRRNTEAGRIVVSEFGTKGIPDPCDTIFHRLTSVFRKSESTDNDLVSIVPYGDEVYACSETDQIWRIDTQTLDSINKVKLSEYVPVTSATAHPHVDSDGTVYNVGAAPGLTFHYCILQFPGVPQEGSMFERASCLCRIPSSRSLSMSYHHSFALTDEFFVFVEQPLTISIPGAMWSKVKGQSFGEALHWDGSRPNRFHVVRRSDNVLLDTVYLSDSFCVFHHINAYVEHRHLVVDLCCFEDGDVVKSLYIKRLEQEFDKERPEEARTKAMRFVLPLDVEKAAEEDGNLVSLQGTQAKASKRSDGSIYCKPEILTGSDNWHPELPRINYEKCNGKKYQYFYSIAQNSTLMSTHLLKVDVVNREAVSWSEEKGIPSEPIFIPTPGGKAEDEGVILASLLYQDDDRKVSVLVLDARTMQEMGRATFVTQSQVPADFHGAFIA